MNNQPNPLVPEGSFLEQKNKGRARVKIAVFFVLAVHGIGLMALLMQGCRREEVPPPGETTGVGTNAVPPTFEPTNQVVAPTNEAFVPANPGTADTNLVAGGMANTNPPVGGGAVTPGGMTEYTVVKGDNFSTIAKKFNVTPKALQEANPNVAPTKLQINQKIMVPPRAPVASGTGVTPPATAEAGGPAVYTVKSGDTLSRIAAQFHVTARAIRTANNLPTDSIKVGQKLKIPVKAPATNAAPVQQ